MKPSYLIATALCDFYKLSHPEQYPANTEYVYSTWTPRSNKHMPYINEVVSFGIQTFIKKYLLKFFKENFFSRSEQEVVEEYRDFIKSTLGIEPNVERIRSLHQLGYLSLEIKAIPEGDKVALGVPMLTIVNTKPEFYWLTNYFETLISCQLWQPMTSASIAHEIKRVLKNYADSTCDNHDHLAFQAHDFSMRGMSSLESAELSGMGHLLSFTGTDTIPAICAAKHYYGNGLPNDYLIGTSIPATEHSVMSAHTKGDKAKMADEFDTYKHLLTNVYPSGFVSIVSDTYDFWHNVENVFPRLKDIIMQRDGRFVVRPDSGKPIDILCGTLDCKYFSDEEDLAIHCEEVEDPQDGGFYCVDNDEDNVYYKVVNGELVVYEPTVEEKGLIVCLWETFGGTYNEKGFRVLDPHIGAIYGDGINLKNMKEILGKLKEQGFASSNIVFGVGSYQYQYQTRDSLGFAMKCTSTICDGVEYQVAKEPKTDSGKKSQRGRVKVTAKDKYVDGLFAGGDYSDDLMITYFKDGELLIDENIDTIRKRLNS